MEIILVKDVERLGKEGAVVRVTSGFARNYLLPRGLALTASPQHLREVEARTQSTHRKAQRFRQQAEQLKQQLEGQSLTLKLSVGESDKAFGAVTAQDIVEALVRDGRSIDKHAVTLEQPIKTLGIYEVPVRLHPEVTATVKVWVVKA